MKKNKLDLTIKKNEKSLAVKFTFFIVLLIVIVQAIFAFYKVYDEKSKMSEELYDNLQNIVNNFANNIALPIYNFDNTSIRNITHNTISFRDVTGIEIVDEKANREIYSRYFSYEEQAIVEVQPVNFDTENYIESSIMYNSEELAVLRLYYTTHFVDQQITTSAWQIIIASMVLVLIFLLVFSYLLKKMVIKQIERIVFQIGNLTDCVKTGQLKVRGEANQVGVDFKEIIFSVNEMIDTFVEPINMVADYIHKIGNGVMPPKITQNYQGDFNDIKQNINQCIDSISNVINSIEILSENMLDGRLYYRAEEQGFEGEYKNIVKGLNESINSLVDNIDSLPGANFIARIDSNFTKLFVSHGVKQLTGYDKGDFINNKVRTMKSLIHKGDLEEAIKKNERGLESKEPYELVYRITTATGQTKWVREQSRVVVDDKGEPVAIEGFISDIDEIKKMEELNKKRTEYLKKQVSVLITNLQLLSQGSFDLQNANDDFDEDTEDLKIQFVRINTSISSMTDTIQKITSNIERYIHLTETGELRLIDFNTDEFKGEYLKMINGLNKAGKLTSDAVTEYINIAINLQEGNLTKKVEGDYKGGFKKLKDCINVVIDNLNSMNSEYKKIEKAVNVGDLALRGDDSNLEGAYLSIMNTTNNILDTIVGPIREISKVMEQISEKNLTVRAEGNFMGDLKELKDDVNTAAKMLEEAMQQVEMAVYQVQAAAGEITSGSQSLAEGASEQASSFEEIASSLEEISSLAANNSQNAGEGKLLAKEADKAVAEGSRNMERMTDAMVAITKSSEETSKIIKTIDEIAFQTNLLALNAAVEAAHAGEAGKGFAVVAEEVKNLALRSAEAAKNTSELIEQSMKNSELGQNIVEDVTNSFKNINQSFGKVNSIVNEVAASSDEQTKGISEVNTAINELNKLTQQIAANAEESASAAEELNSQSHELKSMVTEFDLSEVGNNSKGSPTRRLSDQRDKGTGESNILTGEKAYEIKPNKRLSLDEDFKDSDFE